MASPFHTIRKSERSVELTERLAREHRASAHELHCVALLVGLDILVTDAGAAARLIAEARAERARNDGRRRSPSTATSETRNQT